jgi:hypothetical protein
MFRKTWIWLLGECSLCQTKEMENSKHMFMKCNMVVDVLKNFQALSSSANLSFKWFTWEHVIHIGFKSPNAIQTNIKPQTKPNPLNNYNTPCKSTLTHMVPKV